MNGPGQSQPFMDASQIPVHPAGSVGPQTPAPGVRKHTEPRGVLRFTVDASNERDLLAKAAGIRTAWFGDITDIDMFYEAEMRSAFNGAGDIVFSHFEVDVKSVRE